MKTDFTAADAMRRLEEMAEEFSGKKADSSAEAKKKAAAYNADMHLPILSHKFAHDHSSKNQFYIQNFLFYCLSKGVILLPKNHDRLDDLIIV